MFLRQPIIANDYFMIITIIGPTINRSDASPKSKALSQALRPWIYRQVVEAKTAARVRAC